MRILLWLCACLVFTSSLNAQSFKQYIRGNVVHKFTGRPIDSVWVSIKEIDSVKIITGANGEFEMYLPIGRYNLAFSKDKYETFLATNIVLNSSKEVVLNIEMTERVQQHTREAVIKAGAPKHKAVSELNIVSTRQFSVDETNRYAGSLGDPARMAQNFAGVLSNGDRRNDIIIRGNSPLGVSWRAEGIEIPNPNHFSGIGNTGGSISILNNNNLSNSDFLTGAFNAIYGNATAGVFDLRLKKGNTRKREYLAQIGFNGAELGAEGPYHIFKTPGSFIINARYSTLELFDKMNINLGAAAVPSYKDITFKIYQPTPHAGTFELWGIGGYNTSAFYSKNYDTTGTKLNPRPPGFDTYFDNWMSVVGLNHNYNLSKNTLSKLVLSYSMTGNRTRVDSLYNTNDKQIWLNRLYTDKRLNMSYQIHHKWNTQHQSQVGMYYTNMNMLFNDSLLLTSLNRYLKILSFDGVTHLTRAFVQHQFRPDNKTTIIGGVHFMQFGFNSTNAVEPRLSVSRQLHKKITLHAGVGIHHQLQPLTTYFYARQLNGSYVDSLTNKNLDLMRSKHSVVGIDYLPFTNWRIKLEAYYQYLDNIAVENKATSYSTVNEGAFYYMIPKPFLVNKGIGYNKGLELTVEKFFSQHYYCLASLSWYQSMYKGGDNIWRHTAFDGGNNLSVVGGYEFVFKNKNRLNVNLRFSTSGGRRYSPLDEAASLTQHEAIFIDSAAFSLRYPRYLRPDIKVSYRINAKRISQELGFNIDNFINYQNIQSVEYDAYRNKLGYSYQVGFFPVIQYRIEF